MNDLIYLGADNIKRVTQAVFYLKYIVNGRELLLGEVERLAEKRKDLSILYRVLLERLLYRQLSKSVGEFEESSQEFGEILLKLVEKHRDSAEEVGHSDRHFTEFVKRPGAAMKVLKCVLFEVIKPSVYPKPVEGGDYSGEKTRSAISAALAHNEEVIRLEGLGGKKDRR